MDNNPDCRSDRSTPPKLTRNNSFWLAASKTDSFKQQVPTSEIVYLDADFRSYKYFLTGTFEPEPKQQTATPAIANPANPEMNRTLSELKQAAEVPAELASVDNDPEKERFLRSLNTLNDKIALF